MCASPPALDLASCLLRAIEGDRPSLETLLTMTAKPLSDWIQEKIPRGLRGFLDADDIMQDVLLRITQNIQCFNPGGGRTFLQWATTIAKRILVDRWRMANAIKRGGTASRPLRAGDIEDSAVSLLEWLASHESTASRVMTRAEDIGKLQHALNVLPTRNRLAVEGVYLKNMDAEEVAAVIGCTARAVHGLCDRAKQQLRRICENSRSRGGLSE